ncbi:MAG: Lar family restriction alleviation protein [Oscillospiraceae bacterium]|nr:Lar family restriction alleviation protein [Oscillospiraceae bacterium]
MTDENLKPCPFCGEKRKSRLIGKSLMNEYRPEHFCEAISLLGRKFYRTEQEAIVAWNRRVNNG